MDEIHMTNDNRYQIVFNEDVKHSGNVISIAVKCSYTFDESSRIYDGPAIDSLEYVGNEEFAIIHERHDGYNVFVFDVLLHGDHAMGIDVIQSAIDPYVRQIVLHAVNTLIPRNYFNDSAISSIKTLKNTEYMDYAYLFSYWVNIPRSAENNIFQIIGFAMHSVPQE